MAANLNVTLNGEARALDAGLSVKAMLLSLGLDPAKIAVERNLQIVPRSAYDQVAVGEGDRFEIVHFIGGGNAPVEVPREDKPLVIAGKTYASRLIVGTGKYKSYEDNARALEASGAEMVTVAVRRVNLTDPNQPRLIDFIDPKKYTYLPNTAGCFTGEDAVRTLRLAREAGGWTLVKLEVLGEKKTALSRHAGDLARHRDAGQGRLPGDGLLQRRSLDGQAAGRNGRGGDHAAGVADRLGHGHPEHREHPHDHRGRQSAGDRGCGHRHGVGCRHRDGAGLRRGDFQHGHRPCPAIPCAWRWR